jgi:hypothetical protein
MIPSGIFEGKKITAPEDSEAVVVMRIGFRNRRW